MNIKMKISLNSNLPCKNIMNSFENAFYLETFCTKFNVLKVATKLCESKHSGAERSRIGNGDILTKECLGISSD